jgi:ubiquinone/menaquinone biosynthesis C-methylase UbiE
MKSLLRKLARSYSLTPNTLRYIIEYRCLERAFNRIPRPVNVLADLGAGSGVMALKAGRTLGAEKVIGIEPFTTNFTLLQETFRDVAHAEALQEDILSLPLDDASVDVVLSTQVFEHIRDHEKAAAEVNRILKPGGHAVISTPHPPEMYPNDEHVRPGYTEEEMSRLFAPHGFEPLMTEYFFTIDTLKRLRHASTLPLKGRFLPISFGDREAGLSNEQRRQRQPYGIMMLFRKPGHTSAQ